MRFWTIVSDPVDGLGLRLCICRTEGSKYIMGPIPSSFINFIYEQLNQNTMYSVKGKLAARSKF